MRDDSSTCMGNSDSLSSQFSEENVHEEEAAGDQESAHVRINVERESVGPVCNLSVPVDNSGDPFEPVRTSYITTRPKGVSNSSKQAQENSTPSKQAQEDNIPDLNLSAGNQKDSDSDPFNIEEVFRMEEEAAADANLQLKRGDFISCNMEEEHARLHFENEVVRTLEFGTCLGIDV
ncbi:hypothetical protein Hanom_Chr01g00000711 [Helianthus anomalus]